MYRLLNKAITEFHCYAVCSWCFSWHDLHPWGFGSLECLLLCTANLSPGQGEDWAPLHQNKVVGGPVAPGRRLSKGIGELASAKMQLETSRMETTQVCNSTGYRAASGCCCSPVCAEPVLWGLKRANHHQVPAALGYTEK